MDEGAAQSARRMWSMGDYATIAERVVLAAEELAAAAGPGEGRFALDVAAGTGSLALELASNDWTVTASDLTPKLITQGRERADAAGRTFEWFEASLDDLPFQDESFDLVASSFGLIFAPDPHVALAELHRLLPLGGMLAFSAWTPSGFMANMTEAMFASLPAGPVPDYTPISWGDPEITARWLADGFTGVATATHTLPWSFESAPAALDYLVQNSPAHVAAINDAGRAAEAMKADLLAFLSGLAAADGTLDIAAEYVITTARKE